MPQVGAVAAFVGTMRDRNDGAQISAMELEHYPGMTEHAIEAMVDEARRRFGIRGARVIHRVGHCCRGDQIVLVAVTSGASRAKRSGLRVPDGLPEDSGAFLEGGPRRGRALGRCAAGRRRRPGAGGVELDGRNAGWRAIPARMANARVGGRVKMTRGPFEEALSRRLCVRRWDALPPA